MKLNLLHIIFSLLLFFNPIFGQAPNLGSLSSFSLFTAAGAFDNVGNSSIRGDIGTNTTSVTGFPTGVVYGNIYEAGDAAATQGAIDVANLYTDLFGRTCGAVIGTTMGSGQILTPGIYCTGAATTLNGNLILDAQGDPSALFIIQVDGAFSTGTFSSVSLINSASLCNVFWQINGQFELFDNSVFRGTVVANGAIQLHDVASIEGRALTKAGAISLQNNTVYFSPEQALTISGTANLCENQNGVGFSVPLIYNATAYVWTLPAGAVIASGAGTNSITVDFNLGASSGNITVYGTNTCSSGAISPNYVLTIFQLPLTSAIFHQ